MRNKAFIIAGIGGVLFLALLIAIAVVGSVLLRAATPLRPAMPDCPQVDTLDPAAFHRFSAGSCVTLVAPAARSPDPNIWCPANSELPLKGNRLSLIGDVKTLIRRDGDTFSVAIPNSTGSVLFKPLAHEGGYVWLDDIRLFRDLGNLHYLCLVDTLVSIP